MHSNVSRSRGGKENPPYEWNANAASPAARWVSSGSRPGRLSPPRSSRLIRVTSDPGRAEVPLELAPTGVEPALSAALSGRSLRDGRGWSGLFGDEQARTNERAQQLARFDVDATTALTDE